MFFLQENLTKQEQIPVLICTRVQQAHPHRPRCLANLLQTCMPSSISSLVPFPPIYTQQLHKYRIYICWCRLMHLGPVQGFQIFFLICPPSDHAMQPLWCCFCRTGLSRHRFHRRPEWSTSSPWAHRGSSCAAYTPGCRRPPHPWEKKKQSLRPNDGWLCKTLESNQFLLDERYFAN